MNLAIFSNSQKVIEITLSWIKKANLERNIFSNSAKEEMFLSNLHVLAGGSLLFTEKTDCEIAHYSELVALVSM